ncbi:unnamed protein product, partial [Allacma fusca]
YLKRQEFCCTTLFKNFRQTQLLVLIFNIGYAPVVHLFKMLSITQAVLFGYFGIRYFSKLVAFAAFFLVALLFMMIYYVATFGRAFFVTDRMQTFKIELVRNAELRQIGCTQVRHLQKLVASVSNVGIKVGEFHTMERESTPIFIDFVVKTIATLLITYH